MMYLRYLLYFPFHFFVKALAMLLAPLVACFITQNERTDRVKRLGNGQVTLMRDYLIKPLYWFQTHDNAVDEYWYGCFNTSSFFPYLRDATQAQYDASRFMRWLCRVFWIWRNCGYGFSYHLFGRPLDAIVLREEVGEEGAGRWYRWIRRASSFQYKGQIPIVFGLRVDLNFGWKTHTGFPRAMYADRVFSLRLQS